MSDKWLRAERQTISNLLSFGQPYPVPNESCVLTFKPSSPAMEAVSLGRDDLDIAPDSPVLVPVRPTLHGSSQPLPFAPLFLPQDTQDVLLVSLADAEGFEYTQSSRSLATPRLWSSKTGKTQRSTMAQWSQSKGICNSGLHVCSAR